MKEKRIKDAYMNGIDTMEEYKENKALLLLERKELEEKINSCRPKPDTSADVEKNMKKNIQNVYDIISSDQFTDQQKNEALKSIVEKIVYNRDTDTAEIYYYYL